MYVSFFSDYIQSLIDSQKPTFLYYGYVNFDAWMAALQNCAPNAKTEMSNLKTFLEPYKSISGLVIEAITPDVIFDHQKNAINDILI